MIIKYLHIIFFLLLLTFFKANAQGNNQCVTALTGTGDMKLTGGRSFGCAPLTLSVDNADAFSKSPTYIFDYKGGIPQNDKPDKTHTYDKPGVYTLMQISYRIADGGELRACLIITVRDTIQPPFDVKICSNNTITLTILPAKGKDGLDMNYDKYSVDWGDGSTAGEIYSVNGSLSHSYANNQTRRVKVRGSYDFSQCGGTTIKDIIIPNVPPKPVIQQVTSLDATTIELIIENPSNVKFDVLKNEGGQGFQSTPVSVSASGTIKIAANTEQNSCFKLVSADACASNLSSDIACNATLQVAPATDSNVLTWQANTAQSLSVLKNGKAMAEIAALADAAKMNGFSDKNIECQQENCYQLVAQRTGYKAISALNCVKNNLIECVTSTIPIFIPDAFTPNGDGSNDALVLKGEASYFVKLQIFDRWGSNVFNFDDFTTQWKGDNFPNGEYSYRLDAKDKTGKIVSKVGVVRIIR